MRYTIFRQHGAYIAILRKPMITISMHHNLPKTSECVHRLIVLINPQLILFGQNHVILMLVSASIQIHLQDLHVHIHMSIDQVQVPLTNGVSPCFTPWFHYFSTRKPGSRRVSLGRNCWEVASFHGPAAPSSQKSLEYRSGIGWSGSSCVGRNSCTSWWSTSRGKILFFVIAFLFESR